MVRCSRPEGKADVIPYRSFTFPSYYVYVYYILKSILQSSVVTLEVTTEDEYSRVNEIG